MFKTTCICSTHCLQHSFLLYIEKESTTLYSFGNLSTISSFHNLVFPPRILKSKKILTGLSLPSLLPLPNQLVLGITLPVSQEICLNTFQFSSLLKMQFYFKQQGICFGLSPTLHLCKEPFAPGRVPTQVSGC